MLANTTKSHQENPRSINLAAGPQHVFNTGSSQRLPQYSKGVAGTADRRGNRFLVERQHRLEVCASLQHGDPHLELCQPLTTARMLNPSPRVSSSSVEPRVILGASPRHAQATSCSLLPVCSIRPGQQPRLLTSPVSNPGVSPAGVTSGSPRDHSHPRGHAAREETGCSSQRQEI